MTYWMPDFVGSALHAQHMVEKPSKVHICNGSWPVSGTSYIQGLTVGKKLTSSPIKRNTTVKLCAKTSDTAVTAKSDGKVMLLILLQ